MNHVDKVGVFGSSVAALCCLGITAIVSILSSVGLGFLLRDRVLLPLFLVSLGLAVTGLFIDARHHHHRSALVLGVIAGLALLLSSFVTPFRPVAFASIAALITASVWNLRLRRRSA